MTTHNMNYDPAADAQRIVYVRKMRPDEMPDRMSDDDPEATVYAIHDTAGNRVGIAPDRELAFIAARQHELTPVSVH